MAVTLDFGYSKSTSSWLDAYLVLLFASKTPAQKIGKASGPMAIADASRFVELFEMQVGLSPLDIGTYAELVGGDDPVTDAAKRASEARARGMFPIIIGEDRSTTEKYCQDPLVALWGKAGRVEANEAAVFSRNPTVLVGVRAATASAFQTIPASATILTSTSFTAGKESFQEALVKIEDPVHLSIDLDVLSPAVAQTDRSLEPGGFSWYDLVDAIEMVFNSPAGVASVDLVGTTTVEARSPSALLGAQIVLKMAGLLASGLGV